MKSYKKSKSLFQIIPFALAATLCIAPTLSVAQDPVKIGAGTSLSQDELAIFKSAEFQKNFMQSYLAETDIEPKVAEEEVEALQEVLLLLGDDQVDAAASQILSLLDQSQVDSAVFEFTLANIYFQGDQLEEAAEYYQLAVDKFPKFRRAWKNLGIIKVREGKFAEAIPALVKVIELGESSSIIYGLLGFAYSSEENFLSAESAYRMAILMDPVTKDWKMGLARSFFKQERFSEAISLTKQLLKDDPESTDIWLLQANAYIGLKQPMEAAEIYELVDMLGGSTVDSLNILGDIYINEELYNIAAASYTRAMEMDPKKDSTRAVRSAKILAARSAFDETSMLISKIEQTYGSNLDDESRKDLLRLKARISVAQGNGDEEATILEEIVELDPLDGEALILLGQYYGRKDDIEKAVFYYERAAGLEKFEADASVRHGQLLVGQGDYASALPLLRRAQQINYRENIQEYLEQVEKVAKTN